MKRITALLVVTASLTWAGIAAAQDLPPEESFSLYGTFGYGMQDLGDVNDEIGNAERELREAGLAVSLETFAEAIDFGGGVAYQFGEVLALGAEVGYQTSGVSDAYSDVDGSFSRSLDLTLLDVSGVLQLYFPDYPGLYLGASVGAGFGKAEVARKRTGFGFEDDLDEEGDFDGTTVVFGAFTGFRFQFEEGFFIDGRGGYRYRKFDELEGKMSGEMEEGPIQDSGGLPLEFDFSGFYGRVGIGFAFGGY